MQNNAIEFEGKNVDDALAKACKELNAKKDQLRYDIISAGSTGIFGLVGVKKARVRVTRYPSQMGVKETEALSKAGISSLVDEAFTATEAGAGRSSRRSTDGGRRKKPAKSKNKPKTGPRKPAAPQKEVSAEPAAADAPASAARADAINPDHKERSDAVDTAEAPSAAPRHTSRQPLIPAPEAPVKKGEEALRNILDAITDDAVITVDRYQDPVLFKIDGGNSSVIIGKRGQTLEAIQYLVDKIINKHSDERIRVLVDVEGYLETRRQNLEDLALRLAEKAKRTGKPATIGQMTAHDRRIVHMTLKDDKAVRTQSMGDGYYRRLVIFPKKGNRSNQNRRKNTNTHNDTA
ncbi:MAG: RNA-binding protein [Deltaproteobacteria bacterium]|nr:MAG: RNA-binding protein [Deltaproteobacteria bacterium]